MLILPHLARPACDTEVWIGLSDQNMIRREPVRMSDVTARPDVNATGLTPTTMLLRVSLIRATICKRSG